MQTKTDLILGYVPFGTGQHKPFDQVYQRARRIRSMDDVAGCDAVVIWGGEDISPSIYGEKASKYTWAENEPSYRDVIEMDLFKTAYNLGIPIIGVCRGAQLACAMSGGKLVQHVDNHGRSHEITTDKGEKLITSSVHHQMMYPFTTEHKLIAWSSEKRSKQYQGGEGPIEDMNNQVEPEIVYFPKTRALAIQGHPEFMDEQDEFVKYCNDLVREYLL